MCKTSALLLCIFALFPVGATAQRRGREVPPVYTHVPCNIPGAKQERPIDLSPQPAPTTPKVERPVSSDRKEAWQDDRVSCVIEGPARTR